MQKPLMIVIAAGLLVAGIFVYLNRRGPCANVLDQTAPKLSLSVDALAAKGALVIGSEKVQDVSDGARKVGAHLTACCLAQHSDPPLPPAQYQACVNGAKEYDAKIVLITNIIKEADTAKQQGNTQLAEQKAAEAKATVDASTNIERDLGKLAEAANAKPPNAKPYFFFDFKGKTFGDQWEVIRPDPDNYALEKDGLLIVNSKAGSLNDDNIPNLFRLKTAMPEEDWTATVKFSSEFPAINESIFLSLFQDKENWTAATITAAIIYGSGNPNCVLGIGLTWKSPAKVLSWPGTLALASNFGDWNKFVSDRKLSQPIYLRLQRAGHDFIASSRLETSEPDAWVTLNKIAVLHVSGDLVLGFTQSTQGGQTQVKVEWVKIETP